MKIQLSAFTACTCKSHTSIKTHVLSGKAEQGHGRRDRCSTVLVIQSICVQQRQVTLLLRKYLSRAYLIFRFLPSKLLAGVGAVLALPVAGGWHCCIQRASTSLQESTAARLAGACTPAQTDFHCKVSHMKQHLPPVTCEPHHLMLLALYVAVCSCFSAAQVLMHTQHLAHAKYPVMLSAS